MKVDEARGDREPAEIDRFSRRRPPSIGTPTRHDAARFDRDVADHRGTAGAVVDGGAAEDDIDHSRASPPEVTYRSQRPHGAELRTSVTPSPYRHPRRSSPAIAVLATPGMRTRAVVAPSSAARPIDPSTADRQVGGVEDGDRADRRRRPGRRRSRLPDHLARRCRRGVPARSPRTRGPRGGRRRARRGRSRRGWSRRGSPGTSGPASPSGRRSRRPRAAAPAGTSRTGRRARWRSDCARRSRPSAGSPVAQPPGRDG